MGYVSVFLKFGVPWALLALFLQLSEIVHRTGNIEKSAIDVSAGLFIGSGMFALISGGLFGLLCRLGVQFVVPILRSIPVYQNLFYHWPNKWVLERLLHLDVNYRPLTNRSAKAKMEVNQ